MFVTKRSLSRRTVLRGLGATVALPFLDAMVPALSAKVAVAKPVPRVGFFYVPELSSSWKRRRGLQSDFNTKTSGAFPRSTCGC